jgi:glycolate oxidase FAD binding subunit
VQRADRSAEIAAQVRDAFRWGRGLRLRGGDTRAFLGRVVAGEVLNLGGHRGIVDYAPAELVVTARAGTPLLELERVLQAEGQMLGFEPPRFGLTSTLGGAIATGLAGPRRPFAGAARDAVLGVRCVDGTGTELAFGGRVMKNVAGYDLARLMCGAHGTLGVLLDVSLKLLPVPPCESTCVFEMDAAQAVAAMNRHAATALPLSGAAWAEGRLRLRLAGAEAAVRAAARALGGEVDEDGGWWRALRDHRLPFFRGATRLWRIALPSTAPALALGGEELIDWCGGQRWLASIDPGDAPVVRARAAALGGHATLYRGAGPDEEVFHPPAPALHALQRALRLRFDPKRILNPGRIHRDL